MREESKRILSIEILLFLVSIIFFVFSKSFNFLLFNITYLIIFFFGLLILGYDKRKEINNKDVVLIILIFILSYYFISYCIGFFTGFLSTSYSRRFSGILSNIFYNLFFIVISELLRKVVVKKCKFNFLLLFISIFIFSFMELVTVNLLNNLNSNKNILECILSFLPIFSKNILLTYIVYNYSVLISILYRSFMQLPLYIIFIIPNFGEYLNSVILVIFPLIILFVLNNLFVFKNKVIYDSKKEIKYVKISKFCSILLFLILLVIVFLVSGIFRFYALTIGSGSMKPTINVGDVVVIDKKPVIYKEGQIIVFRMNNKFIVHRVNKVINDNNIYSYKTKGDNNNDVDNWIVSSDDIIGYVIFKFKFIGLPTVKISEWVKSGGD